MKIVVIPLDERPCNYNYLLELPLPSEVTLVLPPKEILSNKKTVKDLDKISEWLVNESIDADYLVLSFDTLLYGGIIPSRIHHKNIDEIIRHSEVLKDLKNKNPNIKIFANELIMRCPAYNCADEEPEYFDYCGYDIFRYGELIDIRSQRQLTDEEKIELEKRKNNIKEADLEDFLNRRKINLDGLLHNLELVKDNVIDFFVIPQDDCSEYGFTSIDIRKVKKYVNDNDLEENVVMYPGADEIGLTLISRCLNDYYKYEPKIYVFYSSTTGRNAIPMFEDRPINETIKYHIYAVKGIKVSSIIEADICLGVNNGSEFLDKGNKRVSIVYGKNRNIHSFIDTLNYSLSLNKISGIADVAYCNEADKELINYLKKKKLLFKIDAYAGWNTSSNTLGTTLANLISYYYSKNELKKNKSILNRYIEDYIYMGIVRQKIINIINEKCDPNVTKFNLGNKKEEYEGLAKKLILEETKNFSSDLFSYINDINVNFIWNRTFEIELKLKDNF